jgi:hypothetical protein
MKRYLAFALIFAGLVIAASSFFDRGTEDIDPATGHSAITTKVCSDYPQNARPADCLTTSQVMNANGGVDHPVALVVGLLLLAGGVLLLVLQPKTSDVVPGSSAPNGREWLCTVDDTWNPISNSQCRRCGNGRLGKAPVRGGKPGDVWPDAPFGGAA